MIETRLFIALLLILLPSSTWLLLRQVHSPWWLENSLSTPFIIIFIYIILLLVLNHFISMQQCLVYFAINVVLAICLNNAITVDNDHCFESIDVFQFNIKYIEEESELSELIDHLIIEQYHLITLQGVSQQTKQKFIERLSPYYPHFIRGESWRQQVQSDQLLFSRFAFTNTKYFNSGDHAFLITSQWKLPVRAINLLALHPPSPRNEELWHQRNRTLYRVQHELNNLSERSSLVVGDLNLSKHSNRLNSLRQGMNTKFVNSWPNKPYIFSFWGLAIDHLWVSKPAKICSRQRIDKFTWSDHYAIKTQIHFN